MRSLRAIAWVAVTGLALGLTLSAVAQEAAPAQTRGLNRDFNPGANTRDDFPTAGEPSSPPIAGALEP